MWRIGQMATMSGVSERALRHYDRIGLLRPAAIDRTSGYRWYGVAELARLDRIRGLQRLGLPLRRIAEVIDAAAPELNDAIADTAAVLRRKIGKLSDAAAAAERHVAGGTGLLPHLTRVRGRGLSVRHIHVERPADLAAVCESRPKALLTWLDESPAEGFRAALVDDLATETLVLPDRTVVRAIVPPETAIAEFGRELFAWISDHDLVSAGPTIEEHLTDDDGATATVLEIAVTQMA